MTGLFLLPITGLAQNTQLADSLYEQGRKYDQSGYERRSLSFYQRSYHLYREMGDTLNSLKAGKEYASALMWVSRNDEAKKLYRQLLEEANDPYNRGDILNSLGLLHKRMGNIEEAMKYYQKALPLANTSADSLLIGVVYGNIGGVYNARGNYSKALELKRTALSYYRGLNNKRFIAVSLGNLGAAYRDRSLYDRALEYFNQSLEIRKELGDVNLLAKIYNSIAMVQRRLGNYDQALISYNKSLEYSRKASTPNLTATILNNIGLLYKTLGEYDKALDYYRQSLMLKEDIASPQEIATTIKNIGKLLWEQGKYEEAEPFYKRALEIRKKHGNSYEVASSLNTMVNLALENGDLERAQEYTDQIQAIGDSTSSPDILKDAARFNGRINDIQGNKAEAIRFFKKEYAYSRTLPAYKQMEALIRLASQYHEIHSDSALVYGERAINLIEKHRSNAGAVAALKTGYFGQYSYFYNQMASWTLTYKNDPTSAFKLIEQAKARSLSDELAKASQNIEQKLPEEVRIERKNRLNHLDSLYTTLEQTSSPSRKEDIQSKIRESELSYAAYENKLRETYPEFKSLQLPEPIDLDRAQQICDAETAIMEYAVAGENLIIFLISQDEVRAKQFSISDDRSLEETLTKWVADYKDAILSNASHTVLHRESDKLYQALIKPFESSLTRFSNLIIVPDGALAYLPFEALWQGDRYLIENFNIKYEPSLTSLTLLHKPEASRSRKELLAIAGSNVTDDNKLLSYRKSSLSALPSTLMEVDSIATHFQQVSTLKDDEVSETAFKKLLAENSYRYVHLATHGVIDENKPNRSGLALSTKEAISASSREDGILRSSEIFGLDINSDMVVLSACNTGLGKVVKGEGILGLQRSFFYAGTSTVVVSLWNVYDRSTATMMNEFYKALISENGDKEGWGEHFLRFIGWNHSLPFGEKASAMRKAKLKMINHPLFNHPVYWAPFIVVGR